MTLSTRRLLLVPADAALIQAHLAGPEALARALGREVAAGWPPSHFDAGVLHSALTLARGDAESRAWLIFYLVAPDQRVSGIVGYKGPPAEDGTVQLGVSLLPAYRRQGYATEAVAALVERAFEAPRVARIIAETLPSLLPSVRVLEKNGFRLIGPGSGAGVIRFELERSDFIAGHRQTPDHLRHFLRLLGHQRWADDRALAALERSPDAAALRLLGHVLGAEHVWLARLRGVAPEVAVWPEADLTGCRRLAAANELGLRRYLCALEVGELRRMVRYTNSAGLEFATMVEDILLHLFLHGAYHRGQVAQRLRLAGAVPEATDYIAFARGTPAATGPGR